MQGSQWMSQSTEKQWVMGLKVARGHSDKRNQGKLHETVIVKDGPWKFRCSKAT